MKTKNTSQTKIKACAAIVLSSLVYGNDTYHHHIQLWDKLYQHLSVSGFPPDGKASIPTMRSRDSCNPEKLKPFYMKVNSPGLEGSWAHGRQMKPYEGPLEHSLKQCNLTVNSWRTPAAEGIFWTAIRDGSAHLELSACNILETNWQEQMHQQPLAAK